MMLEQTEQVEIDGQHWIKIIGDTAFESILEGFAAYERVWNDLVQNKRVAAQQHKRVVVQAGGYCGVFPRLLSKSFDLVYTFEPDPLNFFCLALNCQSENIIKAQGALGNTHGLIDVIRTNPSNKGMNVVAVTADAKIPTYRIDDLQLDACDLIALDTEGYELNILSGALQTIETYKPVITVEDPTEHIDSLLNQFGYKLRDFVYRDGVYSV